MEKLYEIAYVYGEQLLWGLRLGAAFFLLLALCCQIRAMTLESKLPVKKALRLIKEETLAQIPTEEIQIEQVPEEPETREKRPLVSFTIPEDARILLEKISVPVINENGWQTTAEKTA